MTYHYALVQLFKYKGLAERLARWSNSLRDCGFEINHRPGSQIPEDYLSRNNTHVEKRYLVYDLIGIAKIKSSNIQRYIKGFFYPPDFNEDQRKKLRDSSRLD
ncbi:hypothetical protein AYI68_g2140 [Smittium mucronatum]|uniref:Uncharacterized protein n=1 Tax=Smittium mucronatum TaxID=133383 RepID=A0A1R0H3K3_9FUNG|nr:hypothetical protein AYI68_g2140 [Smittium mucronatum]